MIYALNSRLPQLGHWLGFQGSINPILTGLLNTRQNRGGAYFTPPPLIHLFFTLEA